MKVFAPFVYIMNRLSYVKKFLLIGLLVLIPISILSVDLFRTLQSSIEVSKQERDGVTYLAPVKTLMMQMQKSRSMVDNGNKLAASQVDAIKAEMKQRIGLVDAMDVKYGEAFGTSAQWSSFKSGWSLLEQQYADLTVDESVSWHIKLIQQLLEMQLDISDGSNMTMDPELSSFSLVNMIINRLPSMMENEALARGLGRSILAGEPITPEAQVNLVKQADAIDRLVDEIGHDWSNAMDGSADMGAMEKRVGSSTEAAQRFSGLVMQVVSGSSSLGSSSFFADGTKAVDEASALYDEALALLGKLVDKRIDRMEVERDTMIAIVGVVLLLVLIFFIAFYLNVKQTVDRLEQDSSRMAQGDLTVRVQLKTKDELARVGEAFNRMAESFADVLRRNQNIAEQVSGSSAQMERTAHDSVGAANQIAAVMRDMAGEAEHQAKSMEQNATAMTEMAEGISRVAVTSSVVNEAAAAVSNEAKNGRDTVVKAAGQMHTIRETAGSTAEAVAQLRVQSEQIGSIVDLITGIAKQTNLLALNANIEAARAGVHGKGFSVVASEVGKLADQSRQLASNIGQLVVSMQQSAANAAARMEQGVAETTEGLALMDAVNGMFASILNEVEQVAAQVEEISAATEQMSAGTEQVAASVHESLGYAARAAEKAQEAAESAGAQVVSMEEVLTASGSLSETAIELQQALLKFKVKGESAALALEELPKKKAKKEKKTKVPKGRSGAKRKLALPWKKKG
ncbi:methyl-accepting chemotaxis protein [Paenibacillus methanolicus]|uniref:Methyl-accepting chemotaxis protein n=1 Tax=Paenibacillus methanolicus TaxID=582686 RepID=A0A5S5BT96_9BACL|nr:methyl-accepting chemotaxis protein [Paenibacillus methanolicus]TYP69422.1 methyl-accepting chemotaxis protein [Paenibacillus methanolicus]